jgi:hypothetical protein
MLRVIAVTLALAAAAAACSGGSSSSPPSDHGGFHGKPAKVFDAAYTACYRQVKQAPSTATSNAVGVPYKPLAVELLKRLIPMTQVESRAFDAGCMAGTEATGTRIVSAPVSIQSGP